MSRKDKIVNMGLERRPFVWDWRAVVRRARNGRGTTKYPSARAEKLWDESIVYPHLAETEAGKLLLY